MYIRYIIDLYDEIWAHPKKTVEIILGGCSFVSSMHFRHGRIWSKMRYHSKGAPAVIEVGDQVILIVFNKLIYCLSKIAIRFWVYVGIIWHRYINTNQLSHCFTDYFFGTSGFSSFHNKFAVGYCAVWSLFSSTVPFKSCLSCVLL